jgi:thioredoxin-dependent peroxiredoxin
MLQAGQKAPEFQLPDQDGKVHSLENYKGKWIVLYFYPKDDTPGCTKEACGFRDNSTKLTDKNIVVLGVSKDKVSSHKKFANKFELNFPLLSDESKEMIQSYEALGEKKFMGKTFMGIHRYTYLINPEGSIAKAYEKVDPSIHADEILKDVETLS